MIAASIQHAAVVRRERDRKGPGKAVLHVPWSNSGRFLRPHIHELDLASPVVIALQRPGAAWAGADGTAVDDVGVIGLHGNEAAFAGAGVTAVAECDRTPIGRAWHRDRRVVLLRRVDAVRVAVVDVDAIELRGRLVVDRRPGDAAIERHTGAAIVALHHAVRVDRIDP